MHRFVKYYTNIFIFCQEDFFNGFLKNLMLTQMGTDFEQITTDDSDDICICFFSPSPLQARAGLIYESSAKNRLFQRPLFNMF